VSSFLHSSRRPLNTETQRTRRATETADIAASSSHPHERAWRGSRRPRPSATARSRRVRCTGHDNAAHDISGPFSLIRVHCLLCGPLCPLRLCVASVVPKPPRRDQYRTRKRIVPGTERSSLITSSS
jgi:hypothetical protein